MDLNQIADNMIKQTIQQNAMAEIKRQRRRDKQRQQNGDDWAKFVAFKDSSRACMQRAIQPIKHQVIEAKLDTDLLIFKGLGARDLDQSDRTAIIKEGRTGDYIVCN